MSDGSEEEFLGYLAYPRLNAEAYALRVCYAWHCDDSCTTLANEQACRHEEACLRLSGNTTRWTRPEILESANRPFLQIAYRTPVLALGN